MIHYITDKGDLNTAIWRLQTAMSHISWIDKIDVFGNVFELDEKIIVNIKGKDDKEVFKNDNKVGSIGFITKKLSITKKGLCIYEIEIVVSINLGKAELNGIYVADDIINAIRKCGYELTTYSNVNENMKFNTQKFLIKIH